MDISADSKMKTTPAPETDNTGQTPSELLEAIQNRAIIHATEPPQPLSKPTVWQGVRFTLGPDEYVVSMDNVAEVIPEPDTTPLPGTKDWVKGIANLHGHLVSIIDLNLFLTVPRLPSHTRHTLVISNNGCRAGLLVDKVHGLVEFTTEDFATELPDNTAATIKAFTRGCYNRKQPFPVFSADRFFNNQRFLAAAEA